MKKKKQSIKNISKLSETIHQEVIDEIISSWNEPELDLYEYCDFDAASDELFSNWFSESSSYQEYFIDGVIDEDILQQMLLSQIPGLNEKIKSSKNLKRQLEEVCENIAEVHETWRDDAIRQIEEEEQERLDEIAAEEEERKWEEEQQRIEEENDLKAQKKKAAQTAILSKLDPEIQEALNIAFDLGLGENQPKKIKVKKSY